MDTFLPAAVVLLTLGSIGLALVNLNAEKNVNKTTPKNLFVAENWHTFSCMETILFGYGIGNSIDRFSIDLKGQAYSDYFFWK
jgi:hypothetical protein